MEATWRSSPAMYASLRSQPVAVVFLSQLAAEGSNEQHKETALAWHSLGAEGLPEPDLPGQAAAVLQTHRSPCEACRAC